jgi:DNA-binding transcriptional LysR family regulator
MTIDLGELHSFATLAEQLHFGRAAELLHISQPALSKQIRRMEEKLGGDLLTRHNGRVALTAAGKVLEERARQMLRESENTEELLRLAVRGEAGLLRVGFGIASLASGLPALLVRFRGRYPHVHIAMRDMATCDQIEALARGEIDVGFVRLPVTRTGLGSLPVLHERLVAAVAPPARYNPAKGLASLRGQPFVVISRATSNSFHDHVLATCRVAGFTPRIVQEANELFTVLNLVRAGIGVSLVPSSARLMHVPQVKLVETRVREAAWTIGLAWNSEHKPSGLVRKFIEMAVDW